MYFSDRFYSNEELPSDYRVTILGARQTAPNITIVRADVPPPEPAGSGHQSQRKVFSRPRTETGRQASVSGEENLPGFHTILYSIGWSPLKCWKKEVSVKPGILRLAVNYILYYIPTL